MKHWFRYEHNRIVIFEMQVLNTEFITEDYLESRCIIMWQGQSLYTIDMWRFNIPPFTVPHTHTRPQIKGKVLLSVYFCSSKFYELVNYLYLWRRKLSHYPWRWTDSFTRSVTLPNEKRFLGLFNDAFWTPNGRMIVNNEEKMFKEAIVAYLKE